MSGQDVASIVRISSATFTGDIGTGSKPIRSSVSPGSGPDVTVGLQWYLALIAPPAADIYN